MIALVGNWRPLKTSAAGRVRASLSDRREGDRQAHPLRPLAGAGRRRSKSSRRPTSSSCPRVARSASPGSSWPPCSGRAPSPGHRLFPIARQSDEYARTRSCVCSSWPATTPTSSRAAQPALSESPLPTSWRAKVVGKTQRELRFANGSTYHALTATQPHRPRPGRLLGPRRRIRLLALAGHAAAGHGVGL